MIRRGRFAKGESSEARQLRDLVRTAMDYGYYISTYPELANLSAQDAADHFIDRGWSEGKWPCDWFDPAYYLDAYPDVVASGLNPFLHYLIYGRAEGRDPFLIDVLNDGDSSPTAPEDAAAMFVNPAVQAAREVDRRDPTVDLVTGSPEFKTWSQVGPDTLPSDLIETMDFGYTREPRSIESPIVVTVVETDSDQRVAQAIDCALRLTSGNVFVLHRGSVGSAVADQPRVRRVERSLDGNLISDLAELQDLDGSAEPFVVIAASVDPSLNSVIVLVDTLRRIDGGVVGAPVFTTEQLRGSAHDGPAGSASRRLRQVDEIDQRFFCVSQGFIATKANEASSAPSDDLEPAQSPVWLQGTVFGLADVPSAIVERIQPESGQHILVIDAEWPTPDRDAGSVYTVNIVRLLLEAGHRVSFASDGLTRDLSTSSHLQSLGVQCIYPLDTENPDSRFDLITPPDVVFAFRYAVARGNHHELRLRWPEAKFIFHSLDLHGLRQLREAKELQSQAARNAARRVVTDELLLFEEFDSGTVVSTYELDFVRERIRSGEVRLLAIPVEVPEKRTTYRGQANVCFVGSFRHPPNVDAVRFLIDVVMPRVRATLPEAVLHIVGQELPADIDVTGEGITYHGFVPDLDDFLTSMDVSVAALRFGAGIKGKVLSSMAAGLPVVGTSIAFEGMGVENRQHALIGDSANDFADAVIEILTNEDLWKQMSAGGLALVENSFSMEAVRVQLHEVARAAGVDLSEVAS